MYWDLTWRLPLLIGEGDRVLLRDDGPPGENAVYFIEERPLKEAYIIEVENYLKEFFRDVDL